MDGKPSLSPTVEDVSTWIAGYFGQHPKAMDTAEGIQRWWLAPRHGDVALRTVELALAKLRA